MSSTTRNDWGRFVLRLALGGLMLFHGIAKARGGVSGIESAVVAKGLPAALAYGVYVGEIVAPLMILLGFFVRTGALILAFNMLMAIYIAHANDVFSLDPRSGGWVIELPMFYLLGAIALALLGGGRIALRRTPE